MKASLLAIALAAIACNAAAQEHMHAIHDNTVHSLVRMDRLEAFDADRGTGQAWKARAWIGTDTDKLWLRSEGERVGGDTQASDLEALYGRPIARWWDVLVGVRHDFGPGPSRDFAAIGVTGVAPGKIELEATAYLGSSGHAQARIEADYDALLTNRLVLQPMLELGFNGEDDPVRHLGSGLSTMETGLRLRYEIDRRFAPYIGIVYERAYGDTAAFRRSAGEGASDTRIVAGVRFWF